MQWRVFNRHTWVGCLVAGSAGRWHFHGARNNAIMPVIGRVSECAIVCAAATPAAYIFVRAYIDHVCGGSARESACRPLQGRARRIPFKPAAASIALDALF